MPVNLEDIANYFSTKSSTNEMFRTLEDLVRRIQSGFTGVDSAIAAAGSGALPPSTTLITLTFSGDGWPTMGLAESTPIFRNGTLQRKGVDYAIQGGILRFIAYPNAGDEAVVALVV